MTAKVTQNHSSFTPVAAKDYFAPSIDQADYGERVRPSTDMQLMRAVAVTTVFGLALARAVTTVCAFARAVTTVFGLAIDIAGVLNPPEHGNGRHCLLALGQPCGLGTGCHVTGTGCHVIAGGPVRPAIFNI